MATVIKVHDDNASQQEKTVELIEGVHTPGMRLTADERQHERKVKWKIDLMILPLLSTVYFLASMVQSQDELLLPAKMLTRSKGSFRSWKRKDFRHGQRITPYAEAVFECWEHFLCRVHCFAAASYSASQEDRATSPGISYTLSTFPTSSAVH